MAHEHQRPRDQVFTLRVWREQLADGRAEWRARLQHLPSGEIRYLRDWTALPGLVMSLLDPARDSGAREPPGPVRPAPTAGSDVTSLPPDRRPATPAGVADSLNPEEPPHEPALPP